MKSTWQARSAIVMGMAYMALAAYSDHATAVDSATWQAPTVKIVEPAAGGAITGPDLRVRVLAEGVELGSRGRNGAHVLLRLDELPAMKSFAERFTFRGVDAGTHRLHVELRRHDGGSFEPAVTASVEFTVTAPTRGLRR